MRNTAKKKDKVVTILVSILMVAAVGACGYFGVRSLREDATVAAQGQTGNGEQLTVTMGPTLPLPTPGATMNVVPTDTPGASVAPDEP